MQKLTIAFWDQDFRRDYDILSTILFDKCHSEHETFANVTTTFWQIALRMIQFAKAVCSEIVR